MRTCLIFFAQIEQPFEENTQAQLIFVLILIGFSILFYFLPWLIAAGRGHHNSGAIFLFNLLLGWTFLGWVLALVWAFTSSHSSQQTVMVNTGDGGSGGIKQSTRPGHAHASVGCLTPIFAMIGVGALLFIVLSHVAGNKGIVPMLREKVRGGAEQPKPQIEAPADVEPPNEPEPPIARKEQRAIVTQLRSADISKKAARALDIALNRERFGTVDEALAAYREVVEKYPNTRAAETAELRIKALISR